MTRNRAAKKVQIAIDKMVDLQDERYGCELVSRILDLLGTLQTRIESGDIHPPKDN